ncbi:sugar-binding transcriptional regulator [Pseudoruegeria sp. HB172150]|uniref:sugar-binding transcriptional regulator n=1 Tax=Pseudoruegeria sp. HB172150 TaxID=2721164 RepID=UPI0015528779|nr:sugar-binding transcriptional regulator [Pseudoruegeria sp. HB172150]
MAGDRDQEATPLDLAARAGWLYYVGGKTQDQIAKELGISRQRAQRMVARAMADGLIRVRMEHPVSHCLALEARLRERFSLKVCRVAPSLGEGVDPVHSIAPFAAAEMERILSSSEPLVMALGTGRTLRATIENLSSMECEQHKLVSLNGNISPDGSASFYDVVMRIADKIRAPHFPMPLPQIASSPEEREVFYSLKPVQQVMRLAQGAGVTFVGIGQMNENAPLRKDGFMSAGELAQMQAAGAAGEIAGWAYDAEGRYLETGTNLRVAGVRVDPPGENLVVGVAAGTEKFEGLQAALKGGLLNGLVTDEPTAKALLT